MIINDHRVMPQRGGAYYNEIDPYAAAWLRNLIAAGHIADGVVDERSIEDVRPSDLAGFTQCHFFAGLGVWSRALRAAGWPDDRPVWSGSCPCQPFSAAGKGAGFADERHLWPAFGHLIKECKPAVVFGEQVASKDVDVWIDLVHADLEAMGYAFGSVPFPSAGVGAPHIRDRNYWVANAQSTRTRGRSRKVSSAPSAVQSSPSRQGNGDAAGSNSAIMRLADHDQHRLGASTWDEFHHTEHHAEPRSGVCGMAHTDGRDAGAERQQPGREQRQQPEDSSALRLAHAQVSGRGEERTDAGGIALGDSAQGIAAGLVYGGADHRPGPTNGYWRNADWLGCTDGKWRPVEPGTFPLAHGATSRVGRLRAYGNAINAEAARVWIECVMEAA